MVKSPPTLKQKLYEREKRDWLKRKEEKISSY
jgi:hypothetical protein